MYIKKETLPFFVLPINETDYLAALWPKWTISFFKKV